MAKRPRISPETWLQIERAVIRRDRSVRSIAEEYGITEAAIRKHMSTHTSNLLQVAEKIAKTEMEFSQLPIISQIKVRKFADDLKMISENLREGAHYSAVTYGKLSRAAMNALKKVNLEAPSDLDADFVKTAAVLQETANRAASIPMALLAANKETIPPDERAKPDFSRMSSKDLEKLEAAAKLLMQASGGD